MKMIQRYAHGYRQGTAGAGVYVLTNTVANINVLFNVVINRISLSVRSYDAVTNQGIDCSAQLVLTNLGGANVDNPALVHATDFFNPILMTKTGFWVRQDLYLNVSAGSVFTLTFSNSLYAVTANNITIADLFAIGYLCPEDYISIDAFAAES